MDDVVKRPRPYRSPKREAQAAATRAEIVTAAHRLFVARGYVRTTLADVAEAAGVAVPTVKLAFGAKRALLLAVWDRAVKDSDDPRPVAEQEWYKDLIAEPDPREQLRKQMVGLGRGKARMAPLIEVIQTAAAADEEIAALWARMQVEFHDNQRELIRALQRKGPLRPGLTEEDATDLLWTLNHPMTYRLLVVVRGWPPERYERWLARTLIEQLIDPAG